MAKGQRTSAVIPNNQSEVLAAATRGAVDCVRSVGLCFQGCAENVAALRVSLVWFALYLIRRRQNHPLFPAAISAVEESLTRGRGPRGPWNSGSISASNAHKGIQQLAMKLATTGIGSVSIANTMIQSLLGLPLGDDLVELSAHTSLGALLSSIALLGDEHVDAWAAATSVQIREEAIKVDLPGWGRASEAEAVLEIEDTCEMDDVLGSVAREVTRYRGHARRTYVVLRQNRALCDLLLSKRKDNWTPVQQRVLAALQGFDVNSWVAELEWESAQALSFLPAHFSGHGKVAASIEENAVSTISYHGEKAYSIGGSAPLSVTDAEHAILQEFITTSTMDSESLQHRVGNPRAPRTLRDLVARYGRIFAPAIHLPGKKGKGGYHVSIRDERRRMPH
jgi:hypothetical protein